jgi:uncharacterized membrane protein YphA (DoxX/SURF4 family)
MLGRWRQIGSETYYLPESRHSRIFLLLAYSSLVFAGSSVMFAFSPAMRASMPGWAQYVWGGFYLVGGLCGVIGVSTRNPAWGVVSLPLLSAAFALYAYSLLAQYARSRSGIVLIVFFLVLNQTLLSIDRWIGTKLLFKTIQESRE